MADEQTITAGRFALVQFERTPQPRVSRVVAPFAEAVLAEAFAIEGRYQHYAIAPLSVIGQWHT
jgi:hypothetical protein